MRALMKISRFGITRGVCKVHFWAQNYFAKLSRAIRLELHRSIRRVSVLRDDDARVGAQVQKPQHMAR
jgi:hypothetical protein